MSLKPNVSPKSTGDLLTATELNSIVDAFDNVADRIDQVEESIPTAIDGQDGESIELRVDSGFIQWKYPSEGSWTNLIALSELEGAPGEEVELRATGTDIEWRLGDGSWIQLVALSSLQGADGDSFLTEESTRIITPKPMAEADNADSTYTRLIDFTDGFSKSGREVSVQEFLLNPDHFQINNGVISLSQAIITAINEGGGGVPEPSQLEISEVAELSGGYNSERDGVDYVFTFTEAQPGDVIMVFQFVNTGDEFPTPAGFTQSHSTGRCRIYTRVRQSGDPAYTFEKPATQNENPALAIAVSGTSVSDIVYGTHVVSDYSGSLTLPNLTSTAGDPAFGIAFVGNTDNFEQEHNSPTSGWTRRARFERTGFFGVVSVTSKDELFDPEVGTGSFVMTNGNSNMEGFLTIIKPSE